MFLIQFCLFGAQKKPKYVPNLPLRIDFVNLAHKNQLNSSFLLQFLNNHLLNLPFHTANISL